MPCTKVFWSLSFIDISCCSAFLITLQGTTSLHSIFQTIPPFFLSSSLVFSFFLFFLPFFFFILPLSLSPVALFLILVYIRPTPLLLLFNKNNLFSFQTIHNKEKHLAFLHFTYYSSGKYHFPILELYKNGQRVCYKLSWFLGT